MTFVSDNATSNNKQTTQLDQLPNLFKSVNHTYFFNHTMQLSAKALLQQFACASLMPDVDSINDNPLDNNEADEMPGINDFEDEGVDNDDNSGGGNEEQNGNDNDEIDEEHEELLDNTADIWSTLEKVF